MGADQEGKNLPLIITDDTDGKSKAIMEAQRHTKTRQAVEACRDLFEERRSVLRLYVVVFSVDYLLLLCWRFFLCCAGFGCSRFGCSLGWSFVGSGHAARVDQVKSIFSIERELTN